jgi:hypothetical protein
MVWWEERAKPGKENNAKAQRRKEFLTASLRPCIIFKIIHNRLSSLLHGTPLTHMSTATAIAHPNIAFVKLP